VFDSHMPCRARAIPRPCRSVSESSRPRHSAAWVRHDMCELALSVHRRHVGDLSAFGFFRLPHVVPRSLLLSETYQSVKLQDYPFGYFRLPRGLSRRTRHCRRMAGARHGMAGKRHGMCELVFNHKHTWSTFKLASSTED
jgi:hypothetical protein